MLNENRFLIVSLDDILIKICNGNKFFWNILWIEDAFSEKISDLSKKINHSPDGFGLSWDMLLELNKQFALLTDITLMGNQDASKNRRYINERTMYESCDIVIQLIDSGYWFVYSKNEELLNKLWKDFKEVKHLESNIDGAIDI